MSYKLYHGKSPTEENIIYDNIIDRENLNLKMDEFLNKINILNMIIIMQLILIKFQIFHLIMKELWEFLLRF